MANPSAQYKVRFDGHVLPGYLQNEDMPIQSRDGKVEVLNRDGGPIYKNGTNFRGVILHFNVLTRLNNNNPGIAHLGDCLEQYRDALRYVTRVESASTLFFGEVAHYMIAQYTSISAPMAAPDSKRIGYTVEFAAEPWFYGPSVETTENISGDDTIVLNMPDTRKTYPRFYVTSGITSMTVSHAPSGKSFTVSGSHATTLAIDCGKLVVHDAANVNRINMLTSGPDFGIYHVGSGSCTFDISNVLGSGQVLARMEPRLER